MKRHLAFLNPAAHWLADIAFPPRCPSCREQVTANGNFCAQCFEQLRMISAPYCHQCGIPFVVSVEKEALCPECLAEPPSFDKARAVMVYDKVSAPLITALKFNDQWAGIQRHAQMMMGASHGLLEGADYLVPVPLHWKRLIKRKYNQSALLAFGISKQSGLHCAPDVLRRMRATQPQMELDRKLRVQNVRKAFAVPQEMVPYVPDKVIVLVDDVITTGATVSACAKVLKKAGAKEIRVLALARTVKD